tara:strand:- start:3646 stop:5616 length:1971 start_codon:yes stop_codon:yes gene_type:complete
MKLKRKNCHFLALSVRDLKPNERKVPQHKPGSCVEDLDGHRFVVGPRHELIEESLWERVVIPMLGTGAGIDAAVHYLPLEAWGTLVGAYGGKKVVDYLTTVDVDSGEYKLQKQLGGAALGGGLGWLGAYMAQDHKLAVAATLASVAAAATYFDYEVPLWKQSKYVSNSIFRALKYLVRAPMMWRTVAHASVSGKPSRKKENNFKMLQAVKSGQFSNAQLEKKMKKNSQFPKFVQQLVQTQHMGPYFMLGTVSQRMSTPLKNKVKHAMEKGTPWPEFVVDVLNPKERLEIQQLFDAAPKKKLKFGSFDSGDDALAIVDTIANTDNWQDHVGKYLKITKKWHVEKFQKFAKQFRQKERDDPCECTSKCAFGRKAKKPWCWVGKNCPTALKSALGFRYRYCTPTDKPCACTSLCQPGGKKNAEKSWCWVNEVVNEVGQTCSLSTVQRARFGYKWRYCDPRSQSNVQLLKKEIRKFTKKQFGLRERRHKLGTKILQLGAAALFIWVAFGIIGFIGGLVASMVMVLITKLALAIFGKSDAAPVVSEEEVVSKSGWFPGVFTILKTWRNIMNNLPELMHPETFLAFLLIVWESVTYARTMGIITQSFLLFAVLVREFWHFLKTKNLKNMPHAKELDWPKLQEQVRQQMLKERVEKQHMSVKN